MATIERVIPILFSLEYGNVEKALHSNRGENGLTYKGIYQSANPAWEGWNIITQCLETNEHDVFLASHDLEEDGKLQDLVNSLYKHHYWDIAKLDEVADQGIANEIFIFGVNAGMPRAVCIAQKICGVKADGVVGKATLAALNKADSSYFGLEYDKHEIEYYEVLARSNPERYSRYLKGWKMRAERV